MLPSFIPLIDHKSVSFFYPECKFIRNNKAECIIPACMYIMIISKLIPSMNTRQASVHCIVSKKTLKVILTIPCYMIIFMQWLVANPYGRRVYYYNTDITQID